jgi:hypothetical protein
VQYLCLNTQFTLSDVFMCRVCTQAKNRQNNTVIELRSVRSFIERTLQDKSAHLRDDQWDVVTF